jgi:hypothetical protein
MKTVIMSEVGVWAGVVTNLMWLGGDVKLGRLTTAAICVCCSPCHTPPYLSTLWGAVHGNLWLVGSTTSAVPSLQPCMCVDGKCLLQDA